MALNEPHKATQTAVEGHQSIGYSHSGEISKVVWGNVPAWFPSVPIMVSRDDFAAKIKHENHVDDHDLRTMCT